MYRRWIETRREKRGRMREKSIEVMGDEKFRDWRRGCYL